MNILSKLIDVILHLDKYLGVILTTYGLWTYTILFVVIFLETGLVFTPFLPGDSLLFTAGAFAGMGLLNIWILYIVLVLAAVLGDTANYWIGYYLGAKIFHENAKYFKRRHLDETQRYFDKYGSETIILARFIPIVRTFAPFLAGLGKMSYWKFLAYNFLGAIAWVALFVFGGFFFGNLKWVQNNFTIVILIIIVASLIPPVVQYINVKSKRNKK